MNEAAPIGPFGRMLLPQEREQFISLSRAAEYNRGDVLFREDDVTRHAALIESGSVKIVRRRPDRMDMDMILAVRGDGDLIGEMGAIDGTPRSASAIAMGPVKAHIIDAPAFESFVRTHDNVAWMLIRSMAERQRDADQRRLVQATEPVARRVATELLDMSERHVAVDGVEGDLVVSQTELAEVVGATREAVAKAIGDLRRAGAIETARRRLTIVDRVKLRETVNSNHSL